MTAAATIVERLLVKKYPNAGRYLFTPEELIRLVSAVQADARAADGTARKPSTQRNRP